MAKKALVIKAQRKPNSQLGNIPVVIIVADPILYTGSLVYVEFVLEKWPLKDLFLVLKRRVGRRK